MLSIYSEQPTFLVDRGSSIPAYQQIINSMTQRITDKEWVVGDKLPSEFELSNMYGVSRVTLRQALSHLEADGIIEKLQGKGIFLKSNPRQHIENLMFPSVTENVNAPKLNSKILGIEACTAPNHEVERYLQIASSEPLTRLTRVFMQQQKPIGLSIAWFKAKSVPGLKGQPFVDNSLSKTLAQIYDIDIVQIENYISCARLDSTTAEILNSVYDAPALQINSQYLLNGKIPVEYSSTLWLAAFTQFHYTAHK